MACSSKAEPTPSGYAKYTSQPYWPSLRHTSQTQQSTDLWPTPASFLMPRPNAVYVVFAYTFWVKEIFSLLCFVQLTS